MTPAISMRRAVPADKDAITELCRAINPDDYVPELLDQNMQLDPPSGFYVVELDGRVVGCHALDSFQPGAAFLYAMRVHPNMQGRGVGTAYAKAQIADAVRQGVRDLFLASSLTNLPAHKVVERNGFVKRGQWFIYEPAPAPAKPLPTMRARPAREEDAQLIASFRERLSGEVLADVIPAHDYPYGFSLIGDGDWAAEGLVVVEGEGALEGAMMLRKSWDGAVYIRRLEGTPEAAADLLGYAAAWGRDQGIERWILSLPARCEPLIAPLELNPETCERWHIFHYRASG